MKRNARGLASFKGDEVGFSVTVKISDIADGFVRQESDRIRDGRKITAALIDKQIRAGNKIRQAVGVEIALRHSGSTGDLDAALKRAVAVSQMATNRAVEARVGDQVAFAVVVDVHQKSC